MRFDLVDLCRHREVPTRIRCNPPIVDRLDHRFFPTRATRPEDVLSAAEGMCGILDIKPPVWRHGEKVTAGCALISVPACGEQVSGPAPRLTETMKPEREHAREHPVPVVRGASAR